MYKYLLVLCIPLIIFALEPKTGEIVIGIICPLSGPHQMAGEQLVASMELASSFINSFYTTELPFARTEGLPDFNYYQIKIYAMDDGNSTTTAKQAVYDLIDIRDACFIVGSITSDITGVIAETCAEEGIPFLSPASSDFDNSEKAFKLTANSENVYTTLFDFLDYIKDEYRIRNLATLNIDDAWGEKAGDQIEEISEKRNFSIDSRIDYYVPELYEDIDLTLQLTQLASYPNSILIQSSYRPGALSLFKHMEASNLTPQAIIGNFGGFTDTYLCGLSDAEGLFVLDQYANDAGWQNFLIRDIKQVFEDSTGMELQSVGALGFTSVFVIGDAVNRAQSVAPQDIENSLLETHFTGDQLIMPWDGVKFDPETRYNMYAKAVVMQIQESRFRTVWPKELSKTEPTWNSRR